MPQSSDLTYATSIVPPPALAEPLVFTHLVGEEEISRCFRFTASFASRDQNVDTVKLLGRRISVDATNQEGTARWFDGFVSAVRLTEIEPRLAHYEAELRPWLWFLGQGRDCRIFQQMSVVEIIEEVFSAYPEARFEKRLQGTYQPREYCVQYDESDLNFVERLMEHEGIFYFFEFDDGGHTLVLADAVSALDPAPGYETVPFHFESTGEWRDRECLFEWALSSTVRPGTYAHTHYDFRKPAADLMARSEQPFDHDLAEAEYYSHPGAHLELARGDKVAMIRREELQAEHQRILARGTTRGLAPGVTFKLEGHPRDDQNDEYLVIRCTYEVDDAAFRAGAGGGGQFQARLEVAPTTIPYRPPRRARRPVMRGPQTATVVGPGGEEIYTDEFARVKVQFHWDRKGGRDENSSCFVRVSQAWAGAGWGFIQIPRIGQEVIVDFIEGNPNWPIITGRVYNAMQPPPYGDKGTQSGWKSDSSPGSGGYNELMFEDKAGSELVNFQAQKDHTLLIKNDRTKLVQHDQSDRIDNNAKHSVGVDLDEDVGNNKTTKVGVDRTVTIGSNDTEKVGLNRSLTVGVDETISIGANSVETIGASHSQTVAAIQAITVKGARNDLVGGAENRTVGGAQINSVGGIRQMSVVGAQSHTIGGVDSWAVGGMQDVTVKGNQIFSVGGGRTTSVSKDDSTKVDGAWSLKVAKSALADVTQDVGVKAGKNMVLEAADQLTLKCGKATIVLKKDGTITIDGKDITLNGSGKINVKASGDVNVKGSKINQN